MSATFRRHTMNDNKGSIKPCHTLGVRRAWLSRRLRLPIAALSWLAAFPIAALDAPLEEATERTNAEIVTATEALALGRADIARERSDLAHRLSALEEEISALRYQMAAAGDNADRLRRRETALERQKATLAGHRRAVIGAIDEFRRATETRMDVVQRQVHHQTLAAIDRALAVDREASEGLSALAPALELSERLALHDPLSQPIAGQALDAAGIRHDGHFVRMGPETFFIGSNTDPGGYVHPDATGGEPLIVPLAAKRYDGVLPALWRDARATLPLDVSGGMLQALAGARRSLPERLRQGGAVMIPLLAIGLLALFVALARYAVLLRMRADGNALLNRLIPCLDANDMATAHREAQTARSPWRAVLTDAVEHWREERTYLEEILQDRIAAIQLDVNRYLPVLSICAAAAPLLGLLGTVTGMIHTFQLITVFGTGDARTLSGGISEALITTQVGLIIAVPSLLLHAYLSRKAKTILSELEHMAIRLIRHATPQTPLSHENNDP